VTSSVTATIITSAMLADCGRKGLKPMAVW
jgi:hypothetical protein